MRGLPVAVVSVFDSFNNFFLELEDFFLDVLGPILPVEDVEFEGNIPEVINSLISELFHFSRCSLVVRRFQGLKCKAPHNGITDHQAAQTDMREHESSELPTTIFTS